jgi:RNA polymerase sigma-70 factor (ECF subfamily)
MAAGRLTTADVTTTDQAGAAASFEPHRRHLLALAYRMLGSLAEAEDSVQEAYMRWHQADRARVNDPRAFLSRIVVRLCLDQIKSARSRRETYVGPWLPEPVLESAGLDADTASDYAHDLSVALMLTLERLSPLERAAFLLHDVFEVGFTEIAATLGRNEAACRQLAARGRARVQASRPRFKPSAQDKARLLAVFKEAAESGNAAALAAYLAEDAVLVSDGGGKRTAALNPIRGAERIIRLLDGLARKTSGKFRLRAAPINGMPGLIVAEPDGGVQTIALEIANGKIAAIYLVRNPDKLRGIAF